MQESKSVDLIDEPGFQNDDDGGDDDRIVSRLSRTVYVIFIIILRLITVRLFCIYWVSL
jgi:hypothetical protein